MLVALLNTPRTQEQWNTWSYNHRLSHDKIRQTLANLTGIQSVTVVNGGSGYTSFPTVEFVGGGGPLAGGVQYQIQLTAGHVTAINILQPGSGFAEVPQVVITGGGGSGAAATAVRGGGLQTNDYQLDPISQADLGGWLQRNSQTHIEMDAAIGVQSINLQDVNLKDERQLQSWIWLHFLEHQTAENFLGISS